jgi:hypothetical protein
LDRVNVEVALPAAETTTDDGLQLPEIGEPAGAPQFKETVPLNPPAEVKVRVYVLEPAAPAFTICDADDAVTEKLATVSAVAALAEKAPLLMATATLLAAEAVVLLLTVIEAVAVPFGPTRGLTEKVAGQLVVRPAPTGALQLSARGTFKLKPVVVVAVMVKVALAPAVID